MNVQRRDDQILIELIGRIIFENLEAVQRELEEILAGDSKHIFLKMDRLNYLDSSALGMLLNLTKETRKKGRKITILAPPSHIQDIFRSTHLDTIFDIQVDEEARATSESF